MESRKLLSSGLAVPVSLSMAFVVAAWGALPVAANETVVVSPSNMHGWAFVDDNTNGPGTGHMVFGPGDPPLGVGSAELAVVGPADRQILVTGAYSGTPLKDIQSISYWTYQTDPTHALTFQFDIRYDPTATKYQGRLVYEPGYYTNPLITPNSWQKWNPLSGHWWESRPPTVADAAMCGQASAGCTWDQILARWPAASILTPGGVLFKAGGGWQPWKGNVDAFTIAISGGQTTYDFEPQTCHEGGGDGDVQDNDHGHKGHVHFNGKSCEGGQQGGDVEESDQTSGDNFKSDSTSAATFTQDVNSHSLTMTGTGIHNGLPVAYTMVAVDNGPLGPGLFSLVLSDGYTISGAMVNGTLAIQ